MEISTLPVGWEDEQDDAGCAYLIDEGDRRRNCGAPRKVVSPFRKPVSPYCPPHHALCHVSYGSEAEAGRLREVEALAKAVGGRRSRDAVGPSRRFSEAARTGRSRDFATKLFMICSKVFSVARHHSRRFAVPITENVAVTPTPERRNHGIVERLERPIADESGRPARPYRAVDTLAAMERRGSITAGMRQAGEDFRARFATAQLDPLRAPDWSRLRVGGSSRFRAEDGPGLRIERARDAVWHAILAVGGIGSPAGSCLWHVVGWERSLKEWALEQGWSGRRVSQEAASGILIAALGALEGYFGISRACDISIS